MTITIEALAAMAKVRGAKGCFVAFCEDGTVEVTIWLHEEYVVDDDIVAVAATFQEAAMEAMRMMGLGKEEAR